MPHHSFLGFHLRYIAGGVLRSVAASSRSGGWVGNLAVPHHSFLGFHLLLRSAVSSLSGGWVDNLFVAHQKHFPTVVGSSLSPASCPCFAAGSLVH